MNFNDQIALTFRIALRGNVSNWRAYAAFAGMLAMILGMVAMMWFLSQPTIDVRGWLCGAASVAGLSLWRAMLPLADAEDKRAQASRGKAQ